MKTDVVAIPVTGMTLQSVEDLLSQPKYQGFPIVEDEQSKILVGYIGRTELRYAIDRLRRERQINLNPQSKCAFAPAPLSTVTPITPTVIISNMDYGTASASIDFSRYVDATPVTVHPRLPLETVMELFRKIGPRVILIEHHGRLSGLVTVKDCLKYQFQAEAAENPREDHDIQRGHEQVWLWIKTVAEWISGKVFSVSGGRIQLGGGLEDRGATARGGGIMDGDEDLADLADDEGVELENR
jgi:chloride channel 3/4/5